MLAVALTLVLAFSPGARAAQNICGGHQPGEGVEDPPGSGIWYQCVLRNPNSGSDVIAEPRPDWPEVPVALLWPASAAASFAVYLVVQRRRRRVELAP